jgi:hypothetical protein
VKRDPALVSLSHDHHQALVVAQKLRRAAPDARAAFLAYWREHGSDHFRQEEEVLLPASARHGDSHHPLVATVLCDHVAIRAAASAEAPEELRRLGERLAAHVRLEERELFPLIEATIPAAELAELARSLQGAPRPRPRTRPTPTRSRTPGSGRSRSPS